MPKFNHKFKTLPQIPGDYYSRWDASTTWGMDDPTAIAAWKDQCGNSPMVTVGAPTVYPAWTTDADGLPCVHFSTDGGLRNTTIASALAATDHTIFMVWKSAITTGSYLYMSELPAQVYFGTRNTIDTDSPFIRANSTDYYSTNAFDDRRIISAYTCTHNGTDDNDLAYYVGETSQGSDTTLTDAAVTGSYLSFGCLGSGATEITGDFYECLVYDRVLTSGEITKVVDYLSNKWTVSATDSASDDISAASTDDNTVGLAGYGLDALSENHVGRQTGEHSVERIRPAFDPLFPVTTWGSLVKFWFDARVTGGMTFATGDARSGGTVSSWTDRTGNVTMNTATSGDSAVTFLPRFKGVPAIQGGTTATPRSLEATAAPTYSTTSAHQSLFWVVVDWEDATGNQAPCCLKDQFLFPTTYTNYASDLPLNDGVSPPCSYVDSASRVTTPLTTRDPRKGKHIILWRLTNDGAGGADVETWYHGIQAPTYNSATVDGNRKPGVGALTASSFDAEGGRCFEMGAVDGNGTAITDANVDALIRFLCEKYDEDYMPDTTPMDIGLQERSTSTVAQTDTCLWYRSDFGLSAGAWALQEECAKFHTDPSLFTMLPYADPAALSKQMGRKVMRATDSSPVTGLVQANNYNSAETTDFPADTLGCSGFHVSEHKTSTTTVNGATVAHYTGYCRFLSTPGANVQHYESSISASWTGSVASDNWVLLGGSYIYDSDGSAGIGETGSTDADPYVWRICNDQTPKESNAPAATSFNTKVSVGCSSSGNEPGDVDTAELIVFKHPLVSREIENLKRYLRYRYNDLFD